MEQFIHTIFEWAERQGVGVAMLIVAIMVLYKKQQRDAINNAAEIKRAWDAKEASEVNRFADMQTRLNLSDIRHETCEKHRNELSGQLFQLALLTGNVEVIGKTKPATQ